MAESFAFERFVLDPGDRRLMRGGEPVELNGRYFDALALLVREQGRLVSKDRFLDEVWRGVPVTDEALTQCIRTLRRQLGDDAAEPRFIETVPKHGYRFIAAVRSVEGQAIPPNLGPGASASWHRALLIGAAGTIGGGLSGFLGGLVYGFIGASQPFQPGMGAASVLVVIAMPDGSRRRDRSRRSGLWHRRGSRHVATARRTLHCRRALGGLLVGAAAKLLGLDAFSLLVRQSPGDITGAMEGLILGGAVGLAVWLSAGWRSRRRSAGLAALCGAAAGLVIPTAGRATDAWQPRLARPSPAGIEVAPRPHQPFVRRGLDSGRSPNMRAACSRARCSPRAWFLRCRPLGAARRTIEAKR